MSQIDSFERFFKRATDKHSVSAEDDKRLYKLAIDTGIIPAFVVRFFYLLWVALNKEAL
jgi:hypothetical protein